MKPPLLPVARESRPRPSVEQQLAWLEQTPDETKDVLQSTLHLSSLSNLEAWMRTRQHKLDQVVDGFDRHSKIVDSMSQLAGCSSGFW